MQSKRWRFKVTESHYMCVPEMSFVGKYKLKQEANSGANDVQREHFPFRIRYRISGCRLKD